MSRNVRVAQHNAYFKHRPHFLYNYTLYIYYQVLLFKIEPKTSRSVSLCGRALCLITAVCPVFLLNYISKSLPGWESLFSAWLWVNGAPLASSRPGTTGQSAYCAWCAATGGTRVCAYFVCMSVCIITSKHQAGLAGQQDKRYVSNCDPGMDTGDTGGSQSS